MEDINDIIIKEEIDSLLYDLKKAYEASGKKVTGEFAEGLDAVYEHNKGTIRGYEYLAGRGKTKKGHTPGEPYLVEKIEQWIKYKGVFNLTKKYAIKSLAYAITKKIHEAGTNKQYHLKIYEQVITPARINKIIDRISKVNANRIIDMITAELELISKV